VGGLILDNTQSLNSVRDYYLSDVPAYGSGHISNNQATTVSGGYGFYIDPASHASASMRMNANTVSTTGGGAGYGFYFHGSPQDLMFDRNETAAETYGIYMDCSAGGAKLDIHLRNSILDANATAGIYLNSCGSVEIEGGWISDSGTTAIDVESGTNITIQKGLQIDGSYSTAAIYLNGTTSSAVQGVNFLGNCGTCIKLNASNSNTVTDNQIGSNGYGIYLAGSSNNALSGNAINATGSFAGILLDSSSNNNHYANLNAFSAGTSTQLSDSGTGNQLSGASVTWPTTGDVVISNGTNSPAGVAEVNGDCLLGVSGAWGVGSCGGGSGNYFNLAQVSGSTITGSGCTFTGGICTVGTATPGVTISNIPAGYNKLIITATWTPAAGGSDDGLVMQLNGDGGGDYWWSAVCPLNPSNKNSGNGGTNPIVLFDAGTAGHQSSGTIIITNYGVVTADGKSWESHGQSWDCSVSGNGGPGSVVGGGWWNEGVSSSYPAITSVTLTKNSGNNMAAGATFTVEGTN
jgi:parallel beta-helix repeat protein